MSPNCPHVASGLPLCHNTLVNVTSKLECMQKIGITQGLNETLHYHRQDDIKNKAVRLILLYNKSMETVQV